MSLREHDFNSFNTPQGVSNTNLTLTALQVETCRPIRAGANTFRAYCPFHGSDHQRSLRLNGDTGHFNCFACGAWGYTEEARERWKEQRQPQPSQPGFKQNQTRVSTHSQTKPNSRQTIPTASNSTSPYSSAYSPVLASSPTSSQSFSQHSIATPLQVVGFAPPPIVKRETTASLSYLPQLLQQYQAALPGSWGEEYLRRRKIPLELAQRYGVGYAPPGEWAHHARDWKYGRLVFPHTSPDGQLVNLYGRAVGSNEKVPKTLRHDHLQGDKGYFNAPVLVEKPSAEQHFWAGIGAGMDANPPGYLKLVRLDGQNDNPFETQPPERVVRPDGQIATEFDGEEPVFVCEGPFDAMSLLAAGKIRVVAIFGVNGWRWEWTRGVRSLIFALDTDETGQKSWRELARQAKLRGKAVAFLPPEAYGEAKDVNEAWQSGVLATYLGTNVTGPGPAVTNRVSPAPTQEPAVSNTLEKSAEVRGSPAARSVPLLLTKDDPRLADPRPDLHKDTWLWKALFQTCLEGPEAFLYGSLHGLRCCGMRLRLAEGGLLKLGASAELSQEESNELEQNLRESHARNLDNLLNRMVARFKSGA